VGIDGVDHHIKEFFGFGFELLFSHMYASWVGIIVDLRRSSPSVRWYRKSTSPGKGGFILIIIQNRKRNY
jgi:hypothetical protein